MLHDFPNGFPQNPNQPGVEDRTTWNFKASGSYDAPWGVRISPVVRHQSGANYRAHRHDLGDRRGSAFSASGTHYVGACRTPTARTTSRCSTSARRRLTLAAGSRIRAYLDAFNLANSHASETIGRATGLGYPKTVADPGAAHGAGRVPVHLLMGW